jgi:hypothetical protein
MARLFDYRDLGYQHSPKPVENEHADDIVQGERSRDVHKYPESRDEAYNHQR